MIHLNYNSNSMNQLNIYLIIILKYLLRDFMLKNLIFILKTYIYLFHITIKNEIHFYSLKYLLF